ncbi:MAG: hypothetical protein ACE5HQ_02565 [Gemmatimonadota bacterium]
MIHWRLTGAGHGWPGQTKSVLPERILGSTTTLVDAAEEVWSFFARYPAP